METKNMICHSGGADGADTIFENECISREIPVVAWSFPRHKTKSHNRKNLTQEELEIGWNKIVIANKSLKRNIYNLSQYVKNLLARDWYQVKNSKSIYAISTIQDNMQIVNGGTGWAVQMALDDNKETFPMIKRHIFVFDQVRNLWYSDVHSTETDHWEWGTLNLIDRPYIPGMRDEPFAGIGSRDINENGINAIKQLFINKESCIKYDKLKTI